MPNSKTKPSAGTYRRGYLDAVNSRAPTPTMGPAPESYARGYRDGLADVRAMDEQDRLANLAAPYGFGL
jgi:hypothetical protein